MLDWLRDRLIQRPRGQGDLGRFGESVAVAELQKRGYEILERNCRLRAGEIDVVARQAGEIVFVEVKTRTSGEHGDPQDAVTAQKARRLVHLGMAYLAQHGLRDVQWRIDVVAVRLDPGGKPKVEIIPAAVEG